MDDSVEIPKGARKGAQKNPHKFKGGKDPLSRRDFLKLSGLVAASSALASCTPPRQEGDEWAGNRANIQETQTSPEYNFEEELEKLPGACMRSTVAIRFKTPENPRMSGTGTVIGRKRLGNDYSVLAVGTAGHCLAQKDGGDVLDSPDSSVELHTQHLNFRQYPVPIDRSQMVWDSWYKEGEDFGLLMVKVHDSVINPNLILGSENVVPDYSAKPGEVLYSLSYPVGVDGNQTPFPISYKDSAEYEDMFRRLFKGYKAGTETADMAIVAGGASGSGAFNREGLLVGVISSGSRSTDTIGRFSIPGDFQSRLDALYSKAAEELV